MKLFKSIQPSIAIKWWRVWIHHEPFYRGRRAWCTTLFTHKENCPATHSYFFNSRRETWTLTAIYSNKRQPLLGFRYQTSTTVSWLVLRDATNEPLRCESKEKPIWNCYKINIRGGQDCARIAKETGIIDRRLSNYMRKRITLRRINNNHRIKHYAFIITALMEQRSWLSFGVGVHCDDVLKKNKYAGTYLFAITTWHSVSLLPCSSFGGVGINPAMALLK